MGTMAILDHTGDTQHSWDTANAEQVKDVERIFNNLMAEGYTGYKMESNGNNGELLRKFDADADTIVMHRNITGG